MDKTVFLITRMDCPSEENIIRMKLDGVEGIQSLEFDLDNRKLAVFHSGNFEAIKLLIDSLNFNSSILSREVIAGAPKSKDDTQVQAELLWKVLWINSAFFVIEASTGLISRSMGLVADSLDMLADAIVYGLSLAVVGQAISLKKRIAGISGYFQLTLAVIGMVEVIRRFLGYREIPDFRVMIIVSIFVLIANAMCLYLLKKSKSEEAHMKAGMIFTSNDVIMNLGVIVAGSLVYFFNSKIPDLIVGALVFLIVSRGALSILKLSR
jgi:Co/Zn/Cd efflux system component